MIKNKKAKNQTKQKNGSNVRRVSLSTCNPQQNEYAHLSHSFKFKNRYTMVSRLFYKHFTLFFNIHR